MASRGLLFAMASLLILSLAVYGDETHWQAGTGDWHLPANWDNGVPVAQVTDAYISNGGTAVIAGGDAEYNWLRVGQGVLELVGGTLTGGPQIIEGVGPEFRHTGGSNMVNGSLVMGHDAGTHGSYVLSGTSSLWVSYLQVGEWGTGTFAQTGGTVFVDNYFLVAWGEGSHGSYFLGGTGQLTNRGADPERIGVHGVGSFEQTGGAYSTPGSLYLGAAAGGRGAYAISAGNMDIGEFHIGEDGIGEFSITAVGPQIAIASLLCFGGNSTFSAVAGSKMHMTGASLLNENTNAANLAGLENLGLIFDGYDPVMTMEVAGVDVGPVASGLDGNFALHRLTIGDTTIGSVQLVDAFDNQPGSPDAEALYVETLILRVGSTLDLNGLSLYYRTLINEGGLILNGTPQYLPEPVGACCYLDGTCTDGLAETSCVCNDGRWTPVTLCAELNPPCAPPGDPIDPFTYLQPNYEWEEWVPTGLWPGISIVGADSFNDAQDFALLYDTGAVKFYHEGYTEAYHWILTNGTTGLTELPPVYPGPIAVTDNSDIYFYDHDGNAVESWPVASSDIIDISYDSERDRIIIATMSGVYARNDDEIGSLLHLSSVMSAFGVEAIDLQSSPLTYDMLQTTSAFNKFDLNGNTQPGGSFLTDLGNSAQIDGIAYTRNKAITAALSGWFVYSKLGFQDHMQEEAALGACCHPDGSCVDYSVRQSCLCADGAWAENMMCESLEPPCAPQDDGDDDGIPNVSDNCPWVENPLQSDVDSDGDGDLCDPCPADEVDACNLSGSGAWEVHAATGGTLITPDGAVAIVAEPGDLGDDNTLSVTQPVLSDPNVPTFMEGTPGVGKALGAYDLRPEDVTYDGPLSVTFVHDVSALDESEREQLGIFVFSTPDEAYIPVTGACEVVEDPPGTHTSSCTAELNHFSRYAVITPLSDGPAIPTTSVWGMIVLSLLTLSVGTLIYMERCPTQQSSLHQAAQ